MKKLFCLLILLLTVDAEAGIRKLKQSTATTVNIHLVNASTGAGVTGATLSSISGFLRKHADTTSATVTAYTFTGNCTALGLGAYNCNLTTTHTDTLGDLTFCYLYPSTVETCDTYEVSSVEDPEFAGDFANVGDILARACADNTATGSWGKRLCDMLDVAVGTRLAPTVALRTLNVQSTGVVEVAGQIDVGTAQGGATTSITLAATASGTAEFYRHKRIILTNGTGAKQSAIIEAFNQTTKVASTSCEGSSTKAWFTNPAADTEYVIVPRNR